MSPNCVNLGVPLHSELLDFRSRWYDPEIGRFISEDPIGLAGGINVYRFAGNNPVQGQDPFCMSEAGGVGGRMRTTVLLIRKTHGQERVAILL